VDEAARTGSQKVGTDSDQDRSPEEIRADIERTRRELGETAAAVAAKTDVKAQAKAKADETKQRATEKKDELLGKAKDASPDSAGQFAGQAATAAKDNPLPVATGAAFVVGFVLGRLTRRS
jgi:ElaB/YqjD/DUF883 family membrane-anchored ribosome-binding protein